jgi:hydrogenase maturation protease
MPKWEQESKTAVLGLGNPVLGDDAVGLRVAETLELMLSQEPIPGVSVLTSTRAGFELIDLLKGFDKAVLVDCLCVPQGQPGSVRRLSLDHFNGSARLVNAHGLSVKEAFSLAGELGIKMPGEVEILAVEAADAYTLGEELTPKVAATVEPLAREIFCMLRG